MGAKRTNRRKSPAKQKRSFTMPAINWRYVFSGVAATAILVSTYQGTMWLMDQPIEAVKVKGTFQRVPSVRIEAALDPFLNEGFLSLNLNAVRSELDSIPWVASSSVRRQWPGVLEVTVAEEQAAARWGKAGLLNTRGELFVEKAKDIPVELPRLSGPRGSERQVAERYFELQKRMEQRGLSVTVLALDKRGSWSMRLSNGVDVRLGSNGIDDRTVRLFRALDEVVAGQSDSIAYIDMRYTNGFAIGWKKAGARNASLDSEIRPHG